MTEPLPRDAGSGAFDPASAEAALRAERDAVVDRLATRRRDLHAVFAASADSNADDEHDPEGQTIAYERSQLGAAILAGQARLAEIDDALQRLDEGGYGICEVCGQPIPPERMAVRPTARTCVQHADRRSSAPTG